MSSFHQMVGKPPFSYGFPYGFLGQHGQHGQHGQVSGDISLVAVTELAAGSWELADVTGRNTGRTFRKWMQSGAEQRKWMLYMAIHCYTLSLKFMVLAKYCQVSKWWILDRYHVPLGSVGGTQPWRVKMSAMGVAVESREVARNGSSQLAWLTWLWTWVGEHPQVIYLDQHFDPHPLCNGRMSPCIERQAGH